MRPTTALAVAGTLAAGASAENYLGFNSGSTLADRSAKFKADFEQEMKTAQNLVNAPGKFNAVRLYTNIQAYSKDDPIQAFDAAVDTNTKLLLGIWASGTDSIDNELNALKKAVDTFGSKLTDLVIGMSIGSEDLYRISATGIANKAGVGAGPDVVVKFINQFKTTFANTALAKVPIGHVDTWDAWTNSSNKAVLDAVDWVGVDEYPYYENGKGNNIKNSGTLFDRAFDAVSAVVGNKPIWVTETGWPTTGPNWDQAVPSVQNAKYYWDEVGCRKLFNKVPTFWYNLRDSNPDNTMKFAITANLSTTPLFDLTCPTHFDTPSTTSSSTNSSSPSATGSATGVSAPGSSATGTTGSSTSGNNASAAGSSAGASSLSPSQSGAQLGKTLSTAVAAGLALVAGVFALL
ncbi:92a39872-f5ee-4f50-98a3-404fced31833 [Thermothielavioides terrestris]|uniref:Glycoside hydrolase family 17 protein n=2 Tax=Thermothielavioides terrestris TaxID=2587410 RepID=G2RA78_THETT|nr:glycoside hydrolase family 17 protein [Thermothielavioides terrestris NRRL 8126]AEO69666.1 glycoside hydrolase family 17 protein [Thermothielavioides terrestris NRRL 8126]SPQ26201.1 92a39872-f5ee-4f50-98a3-404fced31833 [Thermothielavioides terrestris]